MSELTNERNDRNDFHRLLLLTVSATALLACICTARQARAADSGTGPSPLWIELGGQFTQSMDDQELFLPPFVLTTPRPPYITASPTQLQKAPPSSWDGTAKIAFEPAGTDWIFSAAILYGKGSRNKYLNEETAQPTAQYGGNYNAYQDFAAKSSESHTIADFQAGKDVGLGTFENHGSSVVSLGVRYATFNAHSIVGIQSQPTNVNLRYPYHRFYGTFSATRKFSGIGPSLSWDASAGLIGNPSSGSITFDWGLNGAILFGRQRTRVHHQTTSFYRIFVSYVQHKNLVYQHATSPNRSKQVVVPNLGGFAGVSWRYPNAKVSIGYRADMFFGAMDGGIDTAHRENVGFYGPFATVSVGLGG